MCYYISHVSHVSVNIRVNDCDVLRWLFKFNVDGLPPDSNLVCVTL